MNFSDWKLDLLFVGGRYLEREGQFVDFVLVIGRLFLDYFDLAVLGT